MSNKKALKYGNTSEQNRPDKTKQKITNTNNWPYELYI